MRHDGQLGVVWTIVLCGLLCATGPTFAAVTASEIDEAVAATCTYEYGQSPKVLQAVEKLVQETHGNAELRACLEQELAKEIGSDATFAGKQFACRMLWIIGTEAWAPALGKMLVGDDERAAEAACYALSRHPSPAVDTALRDALGKARGSGPVAVINLLGDRRDAQGVVTIGVLAESEEDAVADAAIVALGKIATEQAVGVLAEIRKGGNVERSAAASHAALQCAQELAGRGKPAEARALYEQLAGPGEPLHIRRGALLGRIALGGPEAISQVLSSLRGEDDALKAAAIASVRVMRGENVSKLFADELAGLPAREQVLLIEALVDHGDPVVRGAITRASEHPEAPVRIAALKGLGVLGDASSVAVLARTAVGENAAEAAVAAMSLRMLEGDGVDAAIVEVMGVSEADLRAALIDVLADRGCAGAVPALLREAAGENGDVCTAAFKALGRLAEPAELPVLVELLVNLKAEAALPDAERAVGSVARKIAGESKRADAVLAALNATDQPGVRCSLLRVLGRVANDPAYEALVDAVNSDDAEVRDAGVRALASWPDGRAEHVLLDVFENTRDDTHRVLALRGYLRLLGLAEDRVAQETVRKYMDAMDHARRPEEKKLVLSGLANVKHPDALKAAQACLDDSGVAEEAALAATKIARATIGTDREQVRAAMVKLLAVSKDEDLRGQAEEILRRVDKFGDCISAWQVAGPYTQEGKKYDQLFDIPFGPEEPGAKGVAWRVLPAGTDAEHPCILDLLEAIGGDQRVAYALTWVHSEADQPARLELGSDDGVKAWLNGRLVHANNAARAVIPYTDNADVTLSRGWNSLLLKITQNNGPWGFCARICRPDGTRLEDIRVDCMHKGD